DCPSSSLRSSWRLRRSPCDLGAEGALADAAKLWVHLDLSHHAAIFMVQDVTVIDKRAGNFRIAKIHPDLHAWVRLLAIPIRNEDGVLHDRSFQGLAVDRHHQKMDLVHVERMFLGAV